MYHLKIIALLATAILVAKGCELSQMKLEEFGIECSAKHIGLLLEVQQHPEKANDPKFICDHKSDVADIIMCMMDKVGGCLPPQYESFKKLFPTEEHIQTGIKFICKHKEVLSDDCMDNQMEAFGQCYMAQLGQLANSFNPLSLDPQKILCSVIHSEESCFRTNAGSCQKNFVDTVIEALEIIFPTSKCPETKISYNDLSNTVLGSILVHGVPQTQSGYKKSYDLLYKPKVIKN